jgi:hypothetical protein
VPPTLFGFTWEAPAPGSGYVLDEWQPSFRAPGRPRLGEPEPVIVAPEGMGLRTYEPLRDETGLFRIFADTEPTPEGALAFANLYGLLGDHGLIADLRERLSWPYETLGWEYEYSARFWVGLILEVRSLVGLWDAAREGDRGRLAGFVRWHEGGIELRRPLPRSDYLPEPPPVETTVWTRAERPEVLGLFPRGDLVGPTLFYLQEVLSARLEGIASPRLTWDRVRKRPSVQVVPHSLWGAICLQFALAVEGDRQYQRCPVCGRWFELSPSLNRTNRKTCSVSCRMRVYRGRQERARQLHEAGKTFKQIAKELGVKDVKIVKGWISNRKG